jgi:hypothetical protein
VWRDINDDIKEICYKRQSYKGSHFESPEDIQGKKKTRVLKAVSENTSSNEDYCLLGCNAIWKIGSSFSEPVASIFSVEQ